LVLLVGSSLLIRSLYGLYKVNSGFRRESLVLVKVPTTTAIRLQGDIQRDLLRRISQLPGVKSASLAAFAPVVGPTLAREVFLSGQTNVERVGVNYISPGYFETVGTGLLQGRDFSSLDSSGSPKVAIINRTMRQRYFSDQNPVGKLISIGPSFNPKSATLIIGVVEDAKYDGLRNPDQPFIFVSLAQERAPSSFLVIRTAGDPKSFLAPFRRTLRESAPELAAGELSTLEQTIESTLIRERMMTKLCVAFGLLALTLSCVGLYGLISYGVARRVPEFGLRMALGAGPGDAMWLVLREAELLVVTGLAVGIPAALAVSRLLRNLIFGLTTTDPLSYVTASAVLILVSMAASCLPARRASKVDPVVALRNE
jgi:predicted permease